MNKNLLTVKSLSEKYDLSVAWIRSHLSEIPHYKIHALVRFCPNEFEQWLINFKKGDEMSEKLADVVLEKFKPSLAQRIRDLEYILKNAENRSDLILAREDVITLLKQESGNPRLKILKDKFTKKIGKK